MERITFPSHHDENIFQITTISPEPSNSTRALSKTAYHPRRGKRTLVPPRGLLPRVRRAECRGRRCSGRLLRFIRERSLLQFRNFAAASTGNDSWAGLLLIFSSFRDLVRKLLIQWELWGNSRDGWVGLFFFAC